MREFVVLLALAVLAYAEHTKPKAKIYPINVKK